MTNKDGYFIEGIDIEQLLDVNTISEIFYLKDLQQRKMFLNGDISSDIVAEFVHNILQINADDKDIHPENRKPIIMYITSLGGELDAGFELIDVMLMSKTPIWCVNLGYQYSMAFLIGLAGSKRFASKTAKILIHDGTSQLGGSVSKVRDHMNFVVRYEDRIKEYVLSRSTLTSEEYDQRYREEWYMFADEAKELGFVDYIIGVDCSIDGII